MEVELSTPALLFPAIAILTLGYINRYLGTAGVVRSFKKDYDQGHIHNDVVAQLLILRKRINLSRYMLMLSVIGLFLATLSMFFVFESIQSFAKIAFGLSLLAMLASMVLSLYETFLSNRSLDIEINDILNTERNK